MDSIYFSSFAEPILYRFQAQLRLYFKLSGSFILSDTMEQVEEARYRSARAAMVVRLPIFLIKFPWFDFWEGSFSFSFSFSWINSPENRCRVVSCTYIYTHIYIHIFTIERTILHTLPFFRSSIYKFHLKFHLFRNSRRFVRPALRKYSIFLFLKQEEQQIESKPYDEEQFQIYTKERKRKRERTNWNIWYKYLSISQLLISFPLKRFTFHRNRSVALSILHLP